MGGNPREIFQEKPTQSGRDWKPNPHSAPQLESNWGPRGGKQEKIRQPDHTIHTHANTFFRFLNVWTSTCSSSVCNKPKSEINERHTHTQTLGPISQSCSRLSNHRKNATVKIELTAKGAFTDTCNCIVASLISVFTIRTAIKFPYHFFLSDVISIQQILLLKHNYLTHFAKLAPDFTPQYTTDSHHGHGICFSDVLRETLWDTRYLCVGGSKKLNN